MGNGLAVGVTGVGAAPVGVVDQAGLGRSAGNGPLERTERELGVAWCDESGASVEPQCRSRASAGRRASRRPEGRAREARGAPEGCRKPCGRAHERRRRRAARPRPADRSAVACATRRIRCATPRARRTERPPGRSPSPPRRTRASRVLLREEGRGFFRISRSISSLFTRFRSSESSLRSSLVSTSGGPLPASARARATHSRSDTSVRSRSTATCRIDRSPMSHSRTASALNSGVNDRRGRSSCPCSWRPSSRLLVRPRKPGRITGPAPAMPATTAPPLTRVKDLVAEHASKPPPPRIAIGFPGSNAPTATCNAIDPAPRAAASRSPSRSALPTPIARRPCSSTGSRGRPRTSPTPSARPRPAARSAPVGSSPHDAPGLPSARVGRSSREQPGRRQRARAGSAPRGLGRAGSRRDHSGSILWRRRTRVLRPFEGRIHEDSRSGPSP